MKAGDLVIVPGRPFTNTVYYGEVSSAFDSNDLVELGSFPSSKIPFRRVSWLDSNTPRSLIASELQKYLSKPPAVSKVQRDPSTERFFSYAYKSFILAEKSAVIMEGPKYDGRHPLATHESNRLTTYFVSAFNAIELDKLDEFVTLDMDGAIKAFFDPELITSYTQNFNSPGRFGLDTKSAILAAFVSAAIAISLKSISYSELTNGVEVTNSISPKDTEINKDAGVKLDYLYKSLGAGLVDELNRSAKEAKDDIGLRTPVTVKQ